MYTPPNSGSWIKPVSPSSGSFLPVQPVNSITASRLRRMPATAAIRIYSFFAACGFLFAFSGFFFSVSSIFMLFSFRPVGNQTAVWQSGRMITGQKLKWKLLNPLPFLSDTHTADTVHFFPADSTAYVPEMATLPSNSPLVIFHPVLVHVYPSATGYSSSILSTVSQVVS